MKSLLWLPPFYRLKMEIQGHTTKIQPQWSAQGLTSFNSIPSLLYSSHAVKSLKNLWVEKGSTQFVGETARDHQHLWRLTERWLYLQVKVGWYPIGSYAQEIITGKRWPSGQAGDVRVQGQNMTTPRASYCGDWGRQETPETSVSRQEGSASGCRFRDSPWYHVWVASWV